jgi:hypothetical protein
MIHMKWLTLFVPGMVLLLVFSLVGCLSTPSMDSRQPIKVISVLDTHQPGQPISPAGPTIEITLENVSHESVVSLNVTMEETGDRSFAFDFGVVPSDPLSPGKTINAKRTLVGGGFGGGIPYSLSINGTLQSGVTFDFIWEPTDNKGAQ